jgi:hypothetical protein
MANSRRGEVAATIAGRRYTLCLTLGALAELEGAFAVDDLSALADRFASGRLSAGDVVKLLGAGLRGGGHPFSDGDVAALPASSLEDGMNAVAALLAATFGNPPPNPREPQDA